MLRLSLLPYTFRRILGMQTFATALALLAILVVGTLMMSYVIDK
jgi:hypothetical protein